MRKTKRRHWIENVFGLLAEQIIVTIGICCSNRCSWAPLCALPRNLPFGGPTGRGGTRSARTTPSGNPVAIAIAAVSDGAVANAGAIANVSAGAGAIASAGSSADAGTGTTLCHQLCEFPLVVCRCRMRRRVREVPTEVERWWALEVTCAYKVLEHEGCFELLVRESVPTLTGCRHNTSLSFICTHMQYALLSLSEHL